METTTTSDRETVDKYLHWVGVHRRRSPRTVRAYASVLGMYLAFLAERGLALVDVRIDDVEAFGARVRRKTTAAGAAGAATVRKDVVVVRRFHQWASERDYGLRRVDTVAVPRLPHRTPKPIHDDVWRVLWGSSLDDQDRLWLGLGYFCGLRRAEIVTVGPHEFDLDSGIAVFVRKGMGRHPIEYRACLNVVDQELPHLTMGRAQQWLDILAETATQRVGMGATYLWYDAEGQEELDGNRLNKRLDNRLVPQLELPPHSVTPHRLRHSCATNLLRAGMLPEFVQRQLSHSSIDITMGYMEMSGEMARWWAREKGRVI
jgi:site-specific recombinase XerD